jgi:hypothetical protein
LRHIAIVGARHRTDRDTVDRLVARLPADTVIVSGGASGRHRDPRATRRRRPREVPLDPSGRADDCGTSIIFGTPLRALKRMRLRFVELPLRLAGFGVGDPEFAHTLAFEFDPVGVVDDAIENGVPHHVDSAHAVSQRRRR